VGLIDLVQEIADPVPIIEGVGEQARKRSFIKDPLQVKTTPGNVLDGLLLPALIDGRPREATPIKLRTAKRTPLTCLRWG